MAISLVNNLSMNRSDTAVADQLWTATSATLSDFQAAGGGKFESKLLQVIDEKANNTAGGTSVSGSYAARDLYTVVTNEITGASVASDQITLPAGTYFIQAFCPAYIVAENQALLYNVTDTSNVLIGFNSSANSPGSSTLWIIGRFTIDAEKIFEVRHRCNLARSTNGWGTVCNYGVVEHYTQCSIWQM